MIFVAKRAGKSANKIEQAVAAWRDMGTVLDVAVRPEALRGDVVTFVEQRIESFEYKRLVLFW